MSRKTRPDVGEDALGHRSRVAVDRAQDEVARACGDEDGQTLGGVVDGAGNRAMVDHGVEVLAVRPVNIDPI